MLSKIKRLHIALKAWADQTINPLQPGLLKSTLSPIEKHVANTMAISKEGLFHGSYDGWRTKRCNKILEIYGIDYFRNKKILELGSGHGDIGAFLADLGADVLCLDGRSQNVTFARLKQWKVPRLKVEQFDLEKDFSSYGRFDLIINFGLIYHLTNVDQHLQTCFGMADDMILESVVCDSTDPHRLVLVPGDANVDEETLTGTGSRPSPFYIERLAMESGFAADRYFTADLNHQHNFRYDWKHKNDGFLSENFALRRLWRFRKQPR
jgi:SAM-dependent methyltransferase